MTITDYHTKFYAYELTKKCSSDNDERFAGTLVDAQVDLNPHQIDAALFAFQSPLSKGALLADEVGLGKTIEAGLLIAQKWAEHKRSILIITPANLRKQWYQEITEKFFIPCEILETKSYNADIKKGTHQPFRKNRIIICSYHFAKNKDSDVHSILWDLVVIDEAHRLRNVYKPANTMANTLKLALMSVPKLLLTATPLQNSILELYGLVSIIDDHIFGDLKLFKERYTHLDEQEAFNELKQRLKPVCHRTLRRQVEPYIKFTKRFPLLQEFTPEANEDKLYNLVSEYLRRENLQALPAGQRSLIILVMRKLMASSSYAIAGALETV
ncbi:MAG: DEAD/DEAH box helicase, partial [Candidatus Cloacimonadaceae bacterium]|nr:DEAD/DEAH box helicase [Candidatus Cloacimonadaceae bacterium]